MRFLVLFTATSSALSCFADSTLHVRAAPSVTFRNGTVVGASSNGIENFKGIPYAQPPTGDLRLRAPVPISSSIGTIDGTKVPKSCPQMGLSTSNFPTSIIPTITDLDIFQFLENIGEDCLTLNIWRPAGISANAKLPILFWIYGGAYVSGSTQSYDGASLVKKSVSLGTPVIFVAINYRLGGFGFLPGKEVLDAGVTNLGYRDQRLGMFQTYKTFGLY